SHLFLFSSRRRHSRFSRDWSSDVCSSDLTPYGVATGIVFYLYFILLTKFFGQTLGKMVFGLKVIPIEGDKLTWGTIIFREGIGRSEEHTSELQSRENLVCSLLLEKKKNNY